MADVSPNTDIRFDPSEKPPLPLTIGMGLQLALLSIGGVVLTPAIIIRSGLGEGSDEYLAWAVFAAVIVCGISTILQALGKFRIGAGYILLMGTSGAFIGVCIGALTKSGPATMATLVIVSALMQLLFSAKLVRFRRILTPTVTGTVIMLIAVTVMPILFDMMESASGSEASSTGTDLTGVALSTGTVLVITLLLAMKARGILRLWAPMIGVTAGTIVALFFGMYDTQSVADAAWIGFPTTGWPGIDLSFGAAFWALLPAFIFVTMIGAIETVGDSIAVQQISWRTPRAPDHRTVQGALSADGVGNLLSGLVGTIPNTTYSSSVSMVELTGVASRAVGVALGIIFIFLALIPKFLALVLAIPAPIVGTFLLVLIAMLFVLGMKIIVQSGIDYRNGLICGISFWIGAGLQSGSIFPDFVSSIAAGTLENGMVGGGLVAILLTIISEFTFKTRKRMVVDLDISSLPEINSFVQNFSKPHSWSDDFTAQVEGAAEEALLILCNQIEPTEEKGLLQLAIKAESEQAVLEFIAADSKENFQDRIALMGSDFSAQDLEREISFRMLKHLTASVQHERYHGTEIIILKVKKSTSNRHISI